ncbi:hypothetical protein TNCT_397741 [Trichonephila clavata]|uniref:Uncharacterized protein n=1 Tax=Trichonephila clavata TaxID=2740835 RepID=A0A8X6L641_TRICU|nr:hypothetical protein TNCT_397741 [Trichonephila clavata]
MHYSLINLRKTILTPSIRFANILVFAYEKKSGHLSEDPDLVIGNGALSHVCEDRLFFCFKIRIELLHQYYRQITGNESLANGFTENVIASKSHKKEQKLTSDIVRGTTQYDTRPFSYDLSSLSILQSTETVKILRNLLKHSRTNHGEVDI